MSWGVAESTYLEHRMSWFLYEYQKKMFHNLKTCKVPLWSDHGLYKPNVLFMMAEQDVVGEYEYSVWH